MSHSVLQGSPPPMYLNISTLNICSKRPQFPEKQAIKQLLLFRKRLIIFCLQIKETYTKYVSSVIFIQLHISTQYAPPVAVVPQGLYKSTVIYIITSIIVGY
jgi:hypothetical protein